MQGSRSAAETTTFWLTRLRAPVKTGEKAQFTGRK